MKKLTASVGTLLGSLFMAAPVIANDEPWIIEISRPPEAIPSFGPVISGGIQIAIWIGIILCLLYLIWGGIEWLTSGGAKEGVSAAKSRMTAAIIGLVIVLSAWAVFGIIGHLFGIPITEFEFPEFFPD